MIRFQLEPHTLHFSKPATTSRGLLNSRQTWLVKAWDDAHPERFGIGECAPVAGLSPDGGPLFQGDAEAVISHPESQPLSIPHTVANPLHAVGETLQPIVYLLQSLPSLRFGLESALLDLFNGARRLYFDSPFAQRQVGLLLHGLIWTDDMASMLAQVDARVTDGFGVIKMKVGAHSPQGDLDFLAEVRRRHPTIEIRLDANGAFSLAQAHQFLDSIAPLNITFLEQPIMPGQTEAMSELCATSPIPIALDEELIGLSPDSAQTLLERIGPAHLILKPTLLGGFGPCLRWIEACQYSGAQWWINSMLESSVGHAAICQFTAALDGERVHGVGSGGLYADNLPSPIRRIGNRLWLTPS
jgi:o-succinylbenzoate synthase